MEWKNHFKNESSLKCASPDPNNCYIVDNTPTNFNTAEDQEDTDTMGNHCQTVACGEEKVACLTQWCIPQIATRIITKPHFLHHQKPGFYPSLFRHSTRPHLIHQPWHNHLATSACSKSEDPKIVRWTATCVSKCANEIRSSSRTVLRKHACSATTRSAKGTKEEVRVCARSITSRTAASQNIKNDIGRLRSIQHWRTGGGVWVVSSCNASVGGCMGEKNGAV